MEGSGYGLVVRDVNGSLKIAACHHPSQRMNSMMAEAEFFKWEIQICLNLGFNNVTFETDCITLTQNWSENAMSSSYLHSVLEDCRLLVRGQGDVSLVHVKRNCNKAADFMSKYALTSHDYVWFDVGPFGLGPILLDDRSPPSFYN